MAQFGLPLAFGTQGNKFDRARWAMQGEFVGVAVGDWQGGLPAADRAGNRKRAAQVRSFSFNEKHIEMWLSLVERCVRDAEAAGSNPVISTISSVHNGFELWTLDFL